MGHPYSAWPTPPIPPLLPPSHSDPLESSIFYHPATLGRVVKDYVEEATDYSPDFAGEEQLRAIVMYCQAPELLEIVLDVLKERMICTWPWNIKSLDILHHLLQNGLSLPQTRAHPRAREILAILTNLSARPTDEPEGTGEHVKRKADECLAVVGYSVGEQERSGGSGLGGFWGLGWGRNKDRDRDREKEREREQAELAKTQKAWMDWQEQQQQQHQREQQLRQKAGWDSAWTGLNIQPVGPSSSKMGPTLKKSSAGQGILKKPTDSAWVTPLKDGKGFSFSTTTVTEGPPSADHFQQHQSNHASLLEETLRKRR